MDINCISEKLDISLKKTKYYLKSLILNSISKDFNFEIF